MEKDIMTYIIKLSPKNIINQLSLPHDFPLVDKKGYNELSGDWDKKTQLFINRLAYKGCFDRYVKMMRWEDTVYYQYRVRGKYGETKGHKATEKYLKSIDDLYNSMKRDGFIETETYPGVVITESGEVVWWFDGQHRLSIAKILKVDNIMCRVIIKHSNCKRGLYGSRGAVNHC